MLIVLVEMSSPPQPLKPEKRENHDSDEALLKTFNTVFVHTSRKQAKMQVFILLCRFQMTA